MEKTCDACGLPFPLETGYYRHRGMLSGYLNTCKSCVCARVKRNYDAARPAKSAYEQERARRPARKADASHHQRVHRARHPDRYKARALVNNAIAAGKLTRGACVRCGTTEHVQAHHRDYSRPFEIVWVCFKHHREVEHGQIVIAQST